MKYIGRLICCLIIFCINLIKFDVEARLPKYMAQKAAELLINKSGLTLKEGETSEDFAAKLVDFLYSTEKRQHLANWMKRRLPFKLYGNYVATSHDETHFIQLFDNITSPYTDNEAFRTFINQRFPCWTGTLTCFMMDKNNKANKALACTSISQECQTSLDNPNHAYKVIGILFTLELVDNWNDINSICDKSEIEPTIEEWRTKNRDIQYDPYDCVTVPNTAYLRLIEKGQKKYQGSCMISTIRNLLYILCRDYANSTDIITNNIREDIRDAFSTSIYAVSGTTSMIELKTFADIILPGLNTEYQPTLELFVYTLNSLLKDSLKEISMSVPTPLQYIDKTIYSNLLDRILKKITDHGADITVTSQNPSKLSSDWPKHSFIITDKKVKKKITVVFGKRGTGEHVEIIKIEPENR